MKRKPPEPLNYHAAREALLKKHKYHPSRVRHVGWEVKPVPDYQLPKIPTALDTLLVSLRLTGLPVERIAEMTGQAEDEIRAILKVWGPSYAGVYSPLPEYLAILNIPPYLPAESPDLEGLTYSLVEEAEKEAARECSRLGIAFKRKRRRFERRHP